MTECNFSLKHYFKTLYDYINAGYVILPDAKVRRHIHLRHDVDLSLACALELAKEEQKRDISATYYIMLHSALYNAHSTDSIEQIREIRRLGHNIGLHIDTRCHLPNDFQTISLILGERVGDWRKHLSTITPEFVVPEPRPKGYKYISDSGMNFREGCFCNHIGKWDKMEILIHPAWWTVSPTAKRNRFEIIEDVKEEAKGTVSQSFAGFRDMVQEYMQVIRQ
jgi:hypothetical protein